MKRRVGNLGFARVADPGSLVVSAVRMIALCILSITRMLSRLSYTKETPTWGQVAEHFLLELCGSILETKAFDEV